MPCSPGQDLSPGDRSRHCSPIMPCIPWTCPGSLTCLLCGQAGQPACLTGEPASTQTAGQPSIHPFIHLSGWLLTPSYPPGPEQGLSLGDSSRLCSPRHASHSPDLPWVPPQGTGHWEEHGPLYAPICLSLSDIIALADPPPHHHHTTTSLFSTAFLSPALSFYWCPFFFSPSYKTDS